MREFKWWHDKEHPARKCSIFCVETWIEATRRMQEPGQCGVDGHHTADWTESKVARVCEDLTDSMVEEGYSYPGGQGEPHCTACAHEKEAVEQAVAVTVERCAAYIDSSVECYDDDEGAQRIALRIVAELIRKLSPDPHYVERKELEARLDALKWVLNHWPPLGSCRTTMSDDAWVKEREIGMLAEVAEVHRQLADMDKTEGSGR